jgi:hypothetical protein
MLREMSQSQKDKHRMTLLMSGTESGQVHRHKLDGSFQETGGIYLFEYRDLVLQDENFLDICFKMVQMYLIPLTCIPENALMVNLMLYVFYLN